MIKHHQELGRRITVFTPYYRASTPERQAELDLCLRMNVACPAIHRLILLVDDGHVPPVESAKLDVIQVQARPSYLDWVKLSQQLQPGTVSILANTDIYFDETLERVHDALAGPSRFLALSRYEQLGGTRAPHPNPHWSQDVWGFRVGASIPDAMQKALDIPLGVPRCDNKIAYLFAIRGWSVHNPQSFVHSVHVHETQQRGYDKKADLTILGGVAYVHPATALAEPSRLEFDVWARNIKQIGSITLNGSLDNWLQEANEAVRQSQAPGAEPVTVPVHESASERAKPTSTCRPAASSAEVSLVLSEGVHETLFEPRFKLFRHRTHLMAVDTLSPSTARWIDAPWNAGEPDAHRRVLVTALIPPAIDTPTVRLTDRPEHGDSCNFWQYPAATERQAFENHAAIQRGANIDDAARIVHTYLGLPWATYIDKKRIPEQVPRQIALRLRGLSRLAHGFGYELRVHTVCQQIHWRRLIGTYLEAGVTDLHLSHAEEGITVDDAPGLRIHSWPLFAPNIEVQDRRGGLTIGKPIRQKRYLASFVGAHMKHYRSDVRLKLAELARGSGRDDLLVEVGDTWHFNQTVYQEQVGNKPLVASEREALARSANRYNERLSDSVFSLCPEGAGPNTLRLWESLAVGSIPVILAPRWRPPEPRPGEVDLQSCALFVAGTLDANLFDRLAAVPHEERERMQKAGIALYEQMRRRTAFGRANSLRIS